MAGMFAIDIKRERGLADDNMLALQKGPIEQGGRNGSLELAPEVPLLGPDDPGTDAIPLWQEDVKICSRRQFEIGFNQRTGCREAVHDGISSGFHR
jgi:hypothetical protein